MKTEFTEEQLEAIRAAFINAAGGAPSLTDDDLIAELTKPEFVPKIGEVIINKSNPHDLWLVGGTNHRVFSNWRKLTPLEGGYQDLVDGLKQFANAEENDYDFDGLLSEQYAAKLLSDHGIE